MSENGATGCTNNHAIHTVLQKLKGLHRELGTGLTADYLARRLLAKLGMRMHRYVLVVQPIPDRPRLAARHGAAFEFREIDQNAYVHDWFPRPATAIERRFAQGARCWVAFKDGAPAACQWLLPGPYIEDEVRCRFVPQPSDRVAWDFDIYVIPALRLSRLFALMWDHTDGWMRERGIAWTASRIDTLNRQSIRSHQRMGARIVGRAWFVACGAWQLSHAPNGWRLSRDPADIPDIPVAASTAAKSANAPRR